MNTSTRLSPSGGAERGGPQGQLRHRLDPGRPGPRVFSLRPARWESPFVSTDVTPWNTGFIGPSSQSPRYCHSFLRVGLASPVRGLPGALWKQHRGPCGGPSQPPACKPRAGSAPAAVEEPRSKAAGEFPREMPKYERDQKAERPPKSPALALPPAESQDRPGRKDKRRASLFLERLISGWCGEKPPPGKTPLLASSPWTLPGPVSPGW